MSYEYIIKGIFSISSDRKKNERAFPFCILFLLVQTFTGEIKYH